MIRPSQGHLRHHPARLAAPGHRRRGYVTGISLTSAAASRYRGKRHSYLSAGCPAPQGFPGAVFPFARASFGFAGGKPLTTLTRSCKGEVSGDGRLYFGSKPAQRIYILRTTCCIYLSTVA